MKASKPPLVPMREEETATVRECPHKAGKLSGDGVWRCKRCHVQMSCRDCDGDLATPCVPGVCRCHCHSAACSTPKAGEPNDDPANSHRA
jgi:hypothetical protein